MPNKTKIVRQKISGIQACILKWNFLPCTETIPQRKKQKLEPKLESDKPVSFCTSKGQFDFVRLLSFPFTKCEGLSILILRLPCHNISIYCTVVFARKAEYR